MGKQHKGIVFPSKICTQCAEIGFTEINPLSETALASYVKTSYAWSIALEMCNKLKLNGQKTVQ